MSCLLLAECIQTGFCDHKETKESGIAIGCSLRRFLSRQCQAQNREHDNVLSSRDVSCIKCIKSFMNWRPNLADTLATVLA